MSMAYMVAAAKKANAGKTKREIIDSLKPKYGPGRTKQAFVKQCDINQILQKAQKAGGLSHVQKYPEAVYAEFDQEMDLLTAHSRLERAQQIFSELPSEVRREFQNDAMSFVTWAAKQPPGALAQKIPQIAEPGSYFPNPAQRGGQGAALATAPTVPQAPEASEASETDSQPAIEATAGPEAGSEGA